MDSPHPEFQGPGRLCLVRAHAGFLAGALWPGSLGVFPKGIVLILRAPLQPLTTQSLPPNSHLADRSPDTPPVIASLSMPDSRRHMSTLQPRWLRPELGNQLLALESRVGPMGMPPGAMWCDSGVWGESALCHILHALSLAPSCLGQWTLLSESVASILSGSAGTLGDDGLLTHGPAAGCVSLVITVAARPTHRRCASLPRHREWLQAVFCLFVF